MTKSFFICRKAAFVKTSRFKIPPIERADFSYIPSLWKDRFVLDINTRLTGIDRITFFACKQTKRTYSGRAYFPLPSLVLSRCLS